MRIEIAPLGWSLLLLGLTSCARYEALPTLQNMPHVGLRHQVALMTRYEQLALYESEQSYDYEDAEYFATKGIAAGLGQQVLPDTIESHAVPQSAAAELGQARAILVAALYSGARELLPDQSARCQVAFDCWLSELAEGDDPARLAQCRNDHYTCIAEIAPRPASTAPASGEFLIAFGNNSYRLDEQARAIVARIADAAGQNGKSSISVVGYTDSAGTAQHNLLLSIRRSDAVREALIGAGVDAGRVVAEGRGEEESVALMGDGVRNPGQRRVVVTLR